jgi:DNA polymerase III beta subunit
MKLQVTQENLAKALNTVARVANTRGTLPILSNVLLKTSNNRLSISATNLDIAISHFIGSKIEQEGAITVPARLMQDFVTNLPDSVLKLKLDSNKLHISTDQYNSTINGVSAEDFPVMPAISNGSSATLPAMEFKKALSKVVLAASADDARPVLTGVYFHSDNGETVAAATDSYRLAQNITIKVDEEEKQVSINAIASQLGENTAKAAAEIKGSGEVTLNSRYLIDALNAFSTDEIEFCFNGKLEPCILRSKEEPNYLHLIMPLRS